MPTLIKKTGTDWQITTDGIPSWQEAENWEGGPLCLDGDAEPDTAHTSATAIAINFPAFNDGRGLSLAVLLRTRMGYTGDLYATGEVHEDLLHYMVRCGFNFIALPDDRDADIAMGLLQPYTSHYQGSTDDPRLSFARVQRGADA